MSTRDIENAVKAVLDGMSLPKAWPNQNFDPSTAGNLPYIAVSFVKAGAVSNQIDGGDTIRTWRLIATVVTGANDGSGIAADYADQIGALFPTGRRIETDTAQIVVIAPPDVRDGFPDGVYWRVPVRIDLRIH